MCIPTVIHNDSLWTWEPCRGGVSGIFGNSGAFAATSGAPFSLKRDFSGSVTLNRPDGLSVESRMKGMMIIPFDPCGLFVAGAGGWAGDSLAGRLRRVERGG
jgi:hypothetical protein